MGYGTKTLRLALKVIKTNTCRKAGWATQDDSLASNLAFVTIIIGVRSLRLVHQVQAPVMEAGIEWIR